MRLSYNRLVDRGRFAIGFEEQVITDLSVVSDRRSDGQIKRYESKHVDRDDRTVGSKVRVVLIIAVVPDRRSDVRIGRYV